MCRDRVLKRFFGGEAMFGRSRGRSAIIGLPIEGVFIGRSVGLGYLPVGPKRGVNKDRLAGAPSVSGTLKAEFRPSDGGKHTVYE